MCVTDIHSFSYSGDKVKIVVSQQDNGFLVENKVTPDE